MKTYKIREIDIRKKLSHAAFYLSNSITIIILALLFFHLHTQWLCKFVSCFQRFCFVSFCLFVYCPFFQLECRTSEGRKFTCISRLHSQALMVPGMQLALDKYVLN